MAYSKEQQENIFNQIFDLIESGKSLRFALKEASISSKTFYEWIEQDAEKVKQYARATETRAEFIFDEIIDIADDTTADILLTENGITQNSEFIQRSRVRIDARKWVLSKLNPKKFGDKIDHTTDGEKLNNTFVLEVINGESQDT